MGNIILSVVKMKDNLREKREIVPVSAPLGIQALRVI